MSNATQAAPKRTPLYDVCAASGGKMVDFHGWELAMQFGGILSEHKAVRDACGIFDVSHMGQIFINGSDAFHLIQKTNSNDFRRAVKGKGLYSHLLNERAGLVDDIIGFCIAADRYLVIVNAATTEKDYKWFKKQAEGMRVSVDNASEFYGMLAFQGPKASLVMKDIAPEAATLPRFGIAVKKLFGQDCFITRTGYTGEDGFEVTAPSAVTAMIWNDIVERSRPHGIAPCGLGARDTLRLEAGYLLYGQDVDDEHSSLEANYSWVVKFDKGDFIGKNVLLKQKKEGLRRRLTGIVLEQAGVPRPGCAVYGRDGGRLGVLCSATYSPTLAKGIGVGYMTPAELKEGEPVEVEIHSRRVPAKISKVPFYTGSAYKS